MKKISAIIICSLLCLQAYGQHVLKVTLKDVLPYDSLKCNVRVPGTGSSVYTGQYGQKADSWFFYLPDSVFKRYESMTFLGKYNTNPDLTIYPGFRLEKQNTLGSSDYLFWEDTDTLLLCARHLKRDTIRNEQFYLYKTVIQDLFELINPSPVLRETIETMNLCYDRAAIRETDEQAYKRLLSIIPRAENSRMGMLYVCNNRFRFSSSQLNTLYNLFSESLQNSYWGQLLKEYIGFFSTEFKDTSLQNCQTGAQDSIVTDDHKYTLLVFSASWCTPCHKLIPLLKHFYEKKKEVMDVVYVTLDKPEQLPAWRKLMEEQKIPWRSLAAGSQIEEVRKRYNVLFIPQTYLIYPHKEKVENINIQTPEGKAKIRGL